jgi:dihydrolipoamide dehydrogenase
MRGVYAIGDVTGEPMLAHRAMAQGEMVAEIVAGHKRSWDKRCIPAICFTDPEVVSAGLTPDEAKAVTKEIIIGQFPFMANGRAMTKLGEDGFVRIVARADNHVVLGIQAVGQGVSELSAAFGLAIEMGARLEEHRRHDPFAPDPGRRFPGSRVQGAGARAAYLSGQFHPPRRGGSARSAGGCRNAERAAITSHPALLATLSRRVTPVTGGPAKS